MEKSRVLIPGAGAKMSNFYSTTAQQNIHCRYGDATREQESYRIIDNLAAECTQVGTLLARLWVGVVLLGGKKSGFDA